MSGSTAGAANSVGSLPPCGGGLGRGVAASSVFVATPLPVPPPQGGREPCGTATSRPNCQLARRNSQLQSIYAIPLPLRGRVGEGGGRKLGVCGTPPPCPSPRRKSGLPDLRNMLRNP